MVKAIVKGDFKDSKLQFAIDVKSAVREYIEKIIIPQVEADIEKLFNKTTVGWALGQRGSQGRRRNYPTPKADFIKPKVKIELKTSGVNIYYSIGFDAKEAGGGISKLWYILDFGREDSTWQEQYPSAWFLPQSSTRTKPNSLNVQATRTYIHSNQADGWIGGSGRAKVEDGLVYIRKLPGDEWGGITPRNWSKIIAEEIQKKYQQQGLEVSYTRKSPV